MVLKMEPRFATSEASVHNALFYVLSLDIMNSTQTIIVNEVRNKDKTIES